MDKKLRCQSCGMPLGDGFFGTNADGSETQEFCTFCFQQGDFTNPDMTMEEMIDLSIDNMIKEVGLTEDQAVELANTIIPRLKRWRLVN